jgi:hypothetical protein
MVGEADHFHIAGVGYIESWVRDAAVDKVAWPNFVEYEVAVEKDMIALGYVEADANVCRYLR